MPDNTDFNDLATSQGLAPVKQTVNAAIDAEKGTPYGRYIVKPNGVYLTVVHKDETTEDVYFCTRLKPLGIARTSGGDRFTLVLELTDLDGKVKTWILPQELIYRSGGDEARVQFVNLGGCFGPGTRERSQFADLLKSFVRHPRHLPRVILAESTGWIDRGEHRAFVLPNETIGTLGKETVMLHEPGDGAPDYSPAGTLAEWQAQIGRYCPKNSRLTFAASLPLASALLAPSGGEGGGFNLVGRSGDGKTTAMHIAASVTGHPARQVKTCDNTSNAFESTAGQHNDALLCMDELGQAPADQLGMIVYKLSGGTGRGRADQHGNARQRRQWRIIFFTTGETDLETMLLSVGKRSFAGQELRLANIEADAGQDMGIFEEIHGFNSPADLADHLRDAAGRVYGAVYQGYLKHLVTELNDTEQRPARLAWLKDTLHQFTTRTVPAGASGQVHRVAKRFALVAAGGELGTLYGLTGWPEGEATLAASACFESWLQRRGTAGQGEVSQLMRQVTEFFERHGDSRFTAMGSKSRQPTHNRAGFRRAVNRGMDTDGGIYEYFVLPSVFKAELCQGFEPRWCTRVLIEKQLLQPGSDGKPQSVQWLPGMGAARCYHFPAPEPDDCVPDSPEPETPASGDNIDVPF